MMNIAILDLPEVTSSEWLLSDRDMQNNPLIKLLLYCFSFRCKLLNTSFIELLTFFKLINRAN